MPQVYYSVDEIATGPENENGKTVYLAVDTGKELVYFKVDNEGRTMTAREERGIVIAALTRLDKKADGWMVPSQSGGKPYRVDPAKQTCTCPDHLEHGHKCKHLFAVEFTMKREVAVDGTVTDTRTMTFTEKVVYKQNWPAYEKAQSREKDRVQEMLFDLCQQVAEPEHDGIGRAPHKRRDVLFGMIFKVYSTLSGRRLGCDLQDAADRGYTSKTINHRKISENMQDAELTPILKGLIAASAAPLKAVERDFAIDSSGFSTSKFEKWYDEKYGCESNRGIWVKAHIACGVKTNIITAVRILDKDAADCPQFVPLVKETRKTFEIGEVSADKAYLSLENFEAVADCGGTAFIAFKQNTTGGIGGLFEKMFHYFQYKKEEYTQKYHKRSNVESTFSMVKRKFGDSVRSKDDVSMVNEVLCKLLCHNLCVLNHEECELGIETMFSKMEPKPMLALTEVNN